jgi:hypothetical protein
MKTSELIAVLEARLAADGDKEVYVALQPGWGMNTPGHVVAVIEGPQRVLQANEIDTVDWLDEGQGTRYPCG